MRNLKYATPSGNAEGRRLLFLDDNDIATLRNLTRVIHPADRHSANPILTPEKPWEKDHLTPSTVVHDHNSGRYRMWYTALVEGTGQPRFPCYAESGDGVHWIRPNLGLVEYKGSTDNNILWQRHAEDNVGWIIYHPSPPNEQYCYLSYSYDYGRSSGYLDKDGTIMAHSPDGIHWIDDKDLNPIIWSWGDVNCFIWDPIGRRFFGTVKNCLSLRGPTRNPFDRRVFGFTESTDGIHWTQPLITMMPDEIDDTWADRRNEQNTQFYGMPIIPYEGIYLGFLQVFRMTGPVSANTDGCVHVEICTSRDGYDWTRVGDRTPIIALGAPGNFDHGGIYTTGSLLTMDEHLWLYYTGHPEQHGIGGPLRGGIAVWRRDGLVSLHAEAEGEFTTIPLWVSGNELHLNACIAGSLLVEVMDEHGNVIPGHEMNHCLPVKGDFTDTVVRWTGRSHLVLVHRPVSFRIRLLNGDIYSLWVQKGEL